MCTSLTFTSEQETHFLARTMDFAFELHAKPIVIPRNYQLTFSLGQSFQTTYGFVGSGKNVGDYLLADGVNEKGLAIAELYFLNEAKYTEEPVKDKLNLAPHEFILWVLGSFESVQELRASINKVCLVALELELLEKVLPLHFIITDAQGETVVIETNSGHIELKENPVGVMANSPELEWHLKNLTNYLSLRPTNFPNQTFGNLEIKPFGQGSGTYGLPGGYTSSERFIKTVFQREYTDKGKTSDETTNNILHILDGVTIPKGVNVKDDGSLDYTQYQAVFNLSEKIYFYRSYHSPNIFCVPLTEKLLSKEHPTEFDISETFQPLSLIEKSH